MCSGGSLQRHLVELKELLELCRISSKEHDVRFEPNVGMKSLRLSIGLSKVGVCAEVGVSYNACFACEIVDMHGQSICACYMSGRCLVFTQLDSFNRTPKTRQPLQISEVQQST